MSQGSTPSLCEFDPDVIKYQGRVIRDIRSKFDYSQGVYEILLSGSVGSAKSILLAHIVLTHCLLYPKARALIGRQAMPDLKETLIQKVIEHMGVDLIEGEDYEYNRSQQKFTFSNGSQIISRSWADKNFTRFRSLELSCAAVEELTENSDDYKGFYSELYSRVGRLPHVKENFVIAATNPDAPSHWAHERFITSSNPLRHVYYSITTDNPFLPPQYVEQLKQNFDEKQAQRMIYGKWIEITQEVIYYNYERDRNFIDKPYTFNSAYPICLSFDFNIADNKPMSALAGQYIDGVFHAAKDFVVEGARTQDICDEIIESGIFKDNKNVEVYGDASGKARDTRSTKSDYDIILKALANVEPKLNIKNHVPLSNPPIRERHNITNAMFLDANSNISTYVYNEALVLDKGLRLSKIKQGGRYIEDDSKPYQHVTTCYSYWIHYSKKRINTTPTRIQQLF